jgi:soluble lytic murein transglycosylase-like protein
MRFFSLLPTFLVPAAFGVLSLLGGTHSPPTERVAVPVVRLAPSKKELRLVAELQKAAVLSAAKRLAGPYGKVAVRVAKKNGLPPLVVAAVIHQENKGFLWHCAERVSPAGAIGPMQLMPVTAWSYLKVNPWNPLENISGGARYLAHLVRRLHSLRSALIAYNAGPNSLRAGEYPEEAVEYAEAVLRNSGLSA